MSDKVNLIVTLSKGQYEILKNIQCGSIGSRMIVNAVMNGIPLDENKGEWIEKEVSLDGDIAYECSKCGELFCLIDGTPADNLYNFCPNCGADMRGGE